MEYFRKPNKWGYNFFLKNGFKTQKNLEHQGKNSKIGLETQKHRGKIAKGWEAASVSTFPTLQCVPETLQRVPETLQCVPETLACFSRASQWFPPPHPSSHPHP